MTLALIAIVALALVFDYINGFHDAANSIATVVSTRVLSPRVAVLWAAFFNFVAFLTASVGLASSSSEMISIFLPRIPPFSFTSSAASWIPHISWLPIPA